MRTNQQNFQKAIEAIEQTTMVTEQSMKQILTTETNLPIPYLIDIYRTIKNGLVIDYSDYQMNLEQESGFDHELYHHINAFDRDVIQLFQSYQNLENDQPEYAKNLMVNGNLLKGAQTYYDIATENLEVVFAQWPKSRLFEWKWMMPASYHVYPEQIQDSGSNVFIHRTPNDLDTATQLLKTAEYLKVIRSRCGAANLIHQTVMDQNHVSYTKTRN